MSPARRIALFLAITNLGSWSLLLAFDGFGGTWNPATARAIGILYLCPPALAALLIQGPLLKGPVLEPLGLRISLSRWFLVAWVLPILVLITGAALVSFWPGMRYAFSVDTFIEFQRDVVPVDRFAEFVELTREQSVHPFLRVVLQALAMGITFNFLISLGEEIGFRGFLFKQIEGGFWFRSLVVGGFWGVWLAPLAFRGQFHGQEGYGSVALILLWATATSPLLTYLRIKSGSAVAVAMFRGTFAALTLIPFSFTEGGPAWLVSMHGALGIAGGAVVLAALMFIDRRFSEQPAAGVVEKRQATR